jgi:hypothetical protein
MVERDFMKHIVLAAAPCIASVPCPARSPGRRPPSTSAWARSAGTARPVATGGDVTTDDRGGNLLARHRIRSHVVLRGEGRRVDCECILPDLDTERENVTSPLAGTG